ncbi:MAG TPA: hypothetical protein VNA13_01390 [Xanthomonadales bacterium]|nr:hypothetical protein [Xanthomonadales bacterium]
MVEGRDRGKSPKELTPDARTAAFFGHEVGVLTDALQGIRIGVVGTDKLIRLDEVQGYPRAEIGIRYKNGRKGVKIDELSPGALWTIPFPLRKMRQELISARDQGQQGACVRLIRASYFDPGTRSLVPMPREGDIANYLGLEDDEVAQLRFLDKTQTLYVDNPRLRASGDQTLDSQRAKAYFDDLLGE